MINRVPSLHLIGPLAVSPDAFPAIAAAAVRGGCGAVHIRMPGCATADVLSSVRAIRRDIGNALVIVNDRLDIALIAGADGVQLGERGFSVEDARSILREGMLVGRSVHDVTGGQAASVAGADFVVAGHVFDTPSKQGIPGRGLEWLASLVAAVPVPVIALGGITIERIPDVLATGAHGVSVGRELLLSDDPESSARHIRSVIDDATNRSHSA